MSYWKPILAAFVIFAAGVVTGGLTLNLKQTATRARGDRPPPGAPRAGWTAKPRENHLQELCDRMAKQLELTPTQQGRVEAIVRETHERVRVIVDEINPRTRAEFKQMEARIRSELTPQQIAKFDEMIRQRETWFRRGERPGSPERAPKPPP